MKTQPKPVQFRSFLQICVVGIFASFTGYSAEAASSALVNLVIQPAFSGGLASRGTIGVQANTAGELESLEVRAFGRSRPISLDQLKVGAPILDRSQGSSMVMTALPNFSAAEGGFVRVAYSADEGSELAGRSSLVQIVRDQLSGSWIMKRLHEDGSQRQVMGISLETSGPAVRNLVWEVKGDEAPELNPTEVLRRFADVRSEGAHRQSDRRAKGALLDSGDSVVLERGSARSASTEGVSAL